MVFNRRQKKIKKDCTYYLVVLGAKFAMCQTKYGPMEHQTFIALAAKKTCFSKADQ